MSVVIIDEFYAFDLMEITGRKIDFDLEFQNFLLHYILVIAKVKLFQGTIGRNPIVPLKNGKKFLIFLII